LLWRPAPLRLSLTKPHDAVQNKRLAVQPAPKPVSKGATRVGSGRFDALGDLPHAAQHVEREREKVVVVSKDDCRTYDKAFRVGGGGQWKTCAMRYDETRLV